MGDIALPIQSPPELAPGGRLLSDEWLARLVSKGSTRAFAVLYQRHYQALYRYCRSIVGNGDDAQDALQSAMTRALEALQARERDLAVRPWLFRIVHNEAVSILRRRRPNVSLEEGFEPADGGVERTLEERERFAQLIADLQSLAVRQRAALVLRELSGLSIAEIAAALSTSPGAAKQALFEARCALQEFAEGRAMECEAVRRVISEGDGRVLRGRKIRAHLRECGGCRDFQLMIRARSADLRALAPPLPAAAATAMLARLLAHGAAGGHAGGAAVASSALGSHAAASLTVKALAGVAIVTAATAGTLHLASDLDRKKPVAPRVAPLGSGDSGADVGRPGMRSPPPQRRRGGANALGLTIGAGSQARLGHQRAPGGAAKPVGAAPAAPLPSRLTPSSKASRRGLAPGRSGKHSDHRRSGPPQSRHAIHRHRPPKQLHLTSPALGGRDRTNRPRRPSASIPGGTKGLTPPAADSSNRGHPTPPATAATG